MSRIAITIVLALLTVGATAWPRDPAPVAPGPRVVPQSILSLAPEVEQVVRAVPWDEHCQAAHCARVEAWERSVDGTWEPVLLDGERQLQAAAGPNGFAPPGEKEEGDGRTPTGTYRILTTFSVGEHPGTRMPWRERTEESIVVSWPGRLHNTWIEDAGRRGGTRATMRYGMWLDHNSGRLSADVGPAPVYGKGSGIFVHATNPSEGYAPSEGCIALDAQHVRALLSWLDPVKEPRVVLGR